MFNIIVLAAVFVSGGVCGVFAMVLVGIHSEERSMSLNSEARTHTAATRRMLGVHNTAGPLDRAGVR